MGRCASSCQQVSQLPWLDAIRQHRQPKCPIQTHSIESGPAAPSVVWASLRAGRSAKVLPFVGKRGREILDEIDHALPAQCGTFGLINGVIVCNGGERRVGSRVSKGSFLQQE